MTRFALFRAQTEPPHVDVLHDGKTYRVRLKRHATARRITLLVRGATGDVVMSVPLRTDIDRARDFASEHAEWIASRVADVPHRVPFMPGQRIPLRGVPHMIVRVSEARLAPEALEDAAGNPIIAISGPANSVERQVRAFLKREAAADLSSAARLYAGRAGVKIRRIRLKDTTTRWGSCTSSGHLNFSWRLVMAPSYVLDYLAAHEVSHLHEMNHSDRYWRIVRDLCPTTDVAEAWLKANGTDLHRFG